jgi:hypothetical protein
VGEIGNRTKKNKGESVKIQYNKRGIIEERKNVERESQKLEHSKQSIKI